MWFNEDDDFDDGEAVVPAANDILGKKLESDMDSIGMKVCSLENMVTKCFMQQDSSFFILGMFSSLWNGY
jgi:hypothetical protein